MPRVGSGATYLVGQEDSRRGGGLFRGVFLFLGVLMGEVS